MSLCICVSLSSDTESETSTLSVVSPGDIWCDACVECITSVQDGSPQARRWGWATQCPNKACACSMSARSSSGSWSGGGDRDLLGDTGVTGSHDIIDLDKFMRGAVRPSRRQRNERTARCNELVVDAGAVQRKVPKLGAGAGPGTAAPARSPGPPPLSSAETASSSSSSARPPHGKRFSHDSGLSDGSYTRQKQRAHRRASCGDAALRPGASASSLRAFRTVCERALRDQQAQIARVAQLCERLTESRVSAQIVTQEAAAKAAPSPSGPSHSTSPHTSATSTSRSTRSRDAKRKDKHRTEECKTYKIIMTKLDELNKLFVARARPAPTGVPLAAPSSGSVSVSDKVVATDATLLCPLQNRRSTAAPAPLACSFVQGDIGGVSLVNTCDPRCGFDLNDPVNLYSQAKRLQALPATTQRARAVELAADALYSEPLGPQTCAPGPRPEPPREDTLCGLCRSYWRSLRQYLVTQIFCGPESGAQLTTQQ